MLNQIPSPVSTTSLNLRSLSFTNSGCSLCPFSLSLRNGRCNTTALAVSRRSSEKKKRDEKAKGKIGEDEEKFVEILTNLAESSGMSARERRLIKVREAKRQREHERTHNYPQWAKILEDGCKIDPELRAILGDSIGNPELMKQRFLERVRKKGRDFANKETGSVVAFKVSFRNFNPLDSHIWIELYGEASDRDVDLLGSVIQSWYVVGRLGAFNSSNLQLVDEPMSYNPLYDSEKASKVMPSSFHDISDIEFQDSWARFWVDLGTADFFALDVLLNCLTVLSADHLGIKQVVFGGKQIGDWEEGMTNPQFGYKSYKI